MDVLPEEQAVTMTNPAMGFTFHRRSYPELWSCRYVLYRTEVGRFQDGEKEALVAAVAVDCVGGGEALLQRQFREHSLCHPDCVVVQ